MTEEEMSKIKTINENYCSKEIVLSHEKKKKLF